MFEMPKMEMVEFEVEEIMTVSPVDPSSNAGDNSGGGLSGDWGEPDFG